MPEATDFLKYFIEEWLTERLQYWFNGAARHHNMNNNNLESFNKYLKLHVNSWKTLPLINFLKNLCAYVRNISKLRDPNNSNCIPVAMLPSPKLKDEIKAVQQNIRIEKKRTVLSDMSSFEEGLYLMKDKSLGIKSSAKSQRF